MAKRKAAEDNADEVPEGVGLDALFTGSGDNCVGEKDSGNVENQVEPLMDFAVRRQDLIREQEKDESLRAMWSEAKRACDVNEQYVRCFVDDGVLVRNWRPLDTPVVEHWKVKRQIVVPQMYRKNILELA